VSAGAVSVGTIAASRKVAAGNVVRWNNPNTSITNAGYGRIAGLAQSRESSQSSSAEQQHPR
jgi:hypothetical protein